MKKKNLILIGANLLLAVAVISLVGKKSLRVKHFVAHTIENGESLEELLVIYNPSLVAGSRQVMKLVEQVKLLNPHTDMFTDGVRVSVPVFHFEGMPEKYILHAAGEEREFPNSALLDRAIQRLYNHDRKCPISVMNIGSHGELQDQFVGEAYHWI